MDSNYIIKNAYNYLDNKLEKYRQKVQGKVAKWRLISSSSDNITPIYEFFDVNDKLLFKAECEILGIEYRDENNKDLWVWSWAHVGLDKNQTILSRRLLQYGLDIITKDLNDYFLKSIFINSRLKINDVEVVVILALSIYISKKEYIMKLIDHNRILYFIVNNFIDI